MSRSLRARLTLSYAIVMAIALTIFSAAGLWLQGRWGRAQFDSELTSLSAAVSQAMQEEVGETNDLQKAIAEARMSTNVPGRATAILDVNGRPLGAHWHGLDYRALPMALADSFQPRFITVDSGGSGWRVLLRRESSALGDYVILVAGPLDQLARQERLLSRVLIVATPLIVLGATGVGWWVASSALHPVRRMAAQAEAITVYSADRRLDQSTIPDELRQVARAFNDLLDRLDTALQRQRQFMADASHELRTPVSVIQTAAEVTLARDSREAWEYREALTIMGEQSSRLSRIVGDMLTLARVDVGGYQLVKQSVYLDEIVAECTRAAAILAATKGLQFFTDIQSEIRLVCDERLLHQLLTNLLDNAVRYTPPGGSVTVALKADWNSATLSVSDTGSGIPVVDRERIFDRFVRLDLARAATLGAGLGLPIARWIAEQHSGTLTVGDSPGGGSVFVFRVPMVNLR